MTVTREVEVRVPVCVTLVVVVALTLLDEPVTGLAVLLLAGTDPEEEETLGVVANDDGPPIGPNEVLLAGADVLEDEATPPAPDVLEPDETGTEALVDGVAEPDEAGTEALAD